MIDTYYHEETHILENYASQAFAMYFGESGICALDIETTGLSPAGAHFILGGLLSLEPGGAVLKQFFAEDISEEKRLISEYVREAAKHGALLTYNGKRFDIPFLLARAGKHDLDIPDMPYNLDLYLVLRQHSALGKLLPNLKQKTVEDFMGLWPYRADKISGAESAALYWEYLRSKENFEDVSGFQELMLLHNRDDVLQLWKLLPVLGKTDFHRAMHSLGFPVVSSGRKLFTENITFENNCIRASGRQAGAPADYISYGNAAGDWTVKLRKRPRDFEISIPLLKKSGLAIVDMTKLPANAADELSRFPDRGSGYLIARDQGGVKYAAVNYLIKTLLQKTLINLPEDIA